MAIHSVGPLHRVSSPRSHRVPVSPALYMTQRLSARTVIDDDAVDWTDGWNGEYLRLLRSRAIEDYLSRGPDAQPAFDLHWRRRASGG